ncbi:MAG: response regulator [Cyclobacteriaceae bacterium]
MTKQPIHVLLVDDDQPNLFNFNHLLKSHFTISTALSGELGLTILKENPDIQIVVSDVKMPKMDGYEFVNRVHEISPEIQIIFVTGYAMNTEIKQTMDKGVVARFIQKPVELKKLIAAIQELAEELN